MFSYDCPNGHLVVGPQPPKPICPRCDHGIGNRWRTDPWVVTQAKMARLRGFLTQGKSMSALQVALTSALVAIDSEEEERREIDKFERELMINNPTMYTAYKKRKEAKRMEVIGEDDDPDPSTVEWFIPKTAEEARRFQEEIEGKFKGIAVMGAQTSGNSLLSDADLEELQD